MKGISDRFVTVMGISAGLGAVPAIFLWMILCLPWMDDCGITDSVWTLVGVVALGLAWSVFAAFGWKRGNIGIRIGLTVVVWAFVATVVLLLWAWGIAGTAPG